MAEVLEIRFKSSSRREVGREVHYVLLPCFALLPFHFFMLLSSPQKVKGWETHLPALFILLLGSKSPSFPIAVPRNLDACVQLYYKVSPRWWLLLVMLLWHETFAHHVGQAGLVCLCLGWRQTNLDYVFSLNTCNLHFKQALSFLQALLVEFGWSSFSYLIYECTLE